MGTSGNRKGYKVFSFNTTLRNPKRNSEFLLLFKKYDGMYMNEHNSHNYYSDLVKHGVYKVSNIPLEVQRKYDADIELTDAEVESLINSNPQATGITGRVLTQLRALKDLGFLMFEEKKRINKITITNLGHKLIDEKSDIQNIYAQALIGCHARSPIRTTMLNESRPFLNTLFVINEVKKRWTSLGEEAKGILKHEFGVFVLSMKDCDYKKAANEIIKYRMLFRYEINKEYLENYLKDQNILGLSFNSYTKDYPDDVFRKFEMTGLLVSRGKFKYKYYDFSKYNEEKINLILANYNNYDFINFDSQRAYYDFLDNIIIPWEKDEKLRKRIVNYKQKALGISSLNGNTLEEQELYLDRIFYNDALYKTIKETEIAVINDELLILAGKLDKKSKFEDLPMSLRLEYMLALLLGKRYGSKGLVSNIIYNEEGAPLTHAPSGKCDIIYSTGNCVYILEPTTLRNREQILNSETTNIIRHAEDEQLKDDSLQYRVMMIAPKIHRDVANYFQASNFIQSRSQNKAIGILPLTIEKAVSLINSNDKISDLNIVFDNMVSELINDVHAYVDEING